MLPQSPMLPLFVILALGLLSMRVEPRWALTAFQLAILGLAAIRILSRWRSGQGLGREIGAVALAAIPFWGAIQLLFGWSVTPDRTAEEMLYFTVAAAAFAMAVELDRNARARFLTFSVFLGAAIAFAAILTALTVTPGEPANFGPFVYRNQLAAFMEVLVPVALLRAFESQGGSQRDRAYLYIAAIALMCASVVASGSRAGVVLLAVELIVVPIAASRRGLVSLRAMLPIALATIAAAGLFTFAAGWELLLERFQEANSLTIRWNLDRASWAMFLDRPLTGWGLGAWPEAYPGFALYDDGTFVNQAHNDWAQWAVEGGIPLLLLLVVPIGRAVRGAWASVWGLGLAAMVLHALGDYPFQQRPALAIFLFVMLGISPLPPQAQVPLKIWSSRP